MSDTFHILQERLFERGFDLKQRRSGVWVVHTVVGVIDLGPTPVTTYEWQRFIRRLRHAGDDLPEEGE